MEGALLFFSFVDNGKAIFVVSLPIRSTGEEQQESYRGGGVWKGEFQVKGEEEVLGVQAT